MTATVTIPAPRYPAKIATPEDALERIRRLARPLVFTNGVFDVLHRGHVTCLEQARALGSSLVVAVNSDASVRRLGKGGDRPLNALADRMAVLAALAAVDLVVPFDDDTEAVRLTAWQAAWRISQGLDASVQVAVAKFWAADGGKRVVHAAQHIHGGIGVDREYPLHRYFTYARHLELTLGGAMPQLVKLGDLLAAQA